VLNVLQKNYITSKLQSFVVLLTAAPGILTLKLLLLRYQLGSTFQQRTKYWGTCARLNQHFRIAVPWACLAALHLLLQHACNAAAAGIDRS
jgi:hypothetical protein